VTVTSPLRGPHKHKKEAASPPLISQAGRAGYGAAPPASRVLRIALRATALRAALDPGDHCGPWEQEQRAGPGLPRQLARHANPAVAGVSGPHPELEGTDELAFDTQKAENYRYRSQTLETVKHHLKPNRQRSGGPRHLQRDTAARHCSALLSDSA